MQTVWYVVPIILVESRLESVLMQTVIYYALFSSLISTFSLSLYVGPFNQVLNRFNSISFLKEKNGEEIEPFYILHSVPHSHSKSCVFTFISIATLLKNHQHSVPVFMHFPWSGTNCTPTRCTLTISQKPLSLTSPNHPTFVKQFPPLASGTTNFLTANQLLHLLSKILFRWPRKKVYAHQSFAPYSPYGLLTLHEDLMPSITIYMKTDTVMHVQISLPSPQAIPTWYHIGLHITYSKRHFLSKPDSFPCHVKNVNNYHLST